MDQEPEIMNMRMLGKTGISVSEIGFGAWGIGGNMWQGGTDSEAARALHTAADRGVNFYDTALVYGDGHSEQLIGRFLRERKERMVIATKIPPKNGRWPARAGTPLKEAFPYGHIIESTEKSLKNLGVETIDVQQFHVWTDDWTDLPEWYDAVSALKEAGKIRHFGVSINDHQPDSAIALGRSGKVDAFQVIYNIFDQSPEDGLFALCREMGIGVIVRVPFDEGALTGSISPATRFPEGDFRNRYFRGDRKQEVVNRIERLQPLLGKESATLPELALRFCLQPDVVSTVIPGMRTVTHVEANTGVSDARKLTPGLGAELKKHRWDKNFY
jgi:aryl-alcohol dehydrogenase-like predicted oxidoreductase